MVCNGLPARFAAWNISFCRVGRKKGRSRGLGGVSVHGKETKITKLLGVEPDFSSIFHRFLMQFALSRHFLAPWSISTGSALRLSLSHRSVARQRAWAISFPAKTPTAAHKKPHVSPIKLESDSLFRHVSAVFDTES